MCACVCSGDDGVEEPWERVMRVMTKHVFCFKLALTTVFSPLCHCTGTK
jgi:hypothetical protein